MTASELRPSEAALAAIRVPGFRAAGVHCGIKAAERDLALFVSECPAVVGAVLTRSTMPGAPVLLCRERLAAGGEGRAIVVNSGCANVAMGERGLKDAHRMAALTARQLGCDESEVYVASTGVIGQPLPMKKIAAGIAEAAGELDESGLVAAAEATRTTDTFTKMASRRVRIGGRVVTVAGTAKGSGMLQPNMATMLSFLMSDVAITRSCLRAVLRRVADATYNRVTVDGEGSTSDTVLMLANGVAGNRRLSRLSDAETRRFAAAVQEVATELSRMLARDGEGATKLVTVDVRGAKSNAEAERAARRVANSLLVKTAIYGRDPNWGRILQCIGDERVAIAADAAVVKLCGVPVFRRGSGLGQAAREKAAARLEAEEVGVEVDLGVGPGVARLWTCDLTYDYVRINAEYTT